MIKHVKDLDVKGKKVIVRVDFNVPFKDDGTIRDDNRVRAALPTIQELAKKGARVILMSHLGKIDFKATPEELAAAKKKADLAPVAKDLEGLLPDNHVSFCPATRGEELEKAVKGMKDGDILVMQNTRYEKGETKNDPALAAEWAKLGDAYVNDAFGSDHRAHCSTVGIPEIMKKEGKPVAMGYLVEKEVVALSKCVNVAKDGHPYVAVLGGLKVSDKIKVIESLLKKCDTIIICGAMAYTFFKAQGLEIGTSPVELDQLDYANKCFASGKIVLPDDVVLADDFAAAKVVKTVSVKDIPADMMGMDIGPKSVAKFAKILTAAKTIFWNGPAGVFEQERFQAGTKGVCEAVKTATENGAFTVVGGGDSAAAVKQFGYKKSFSHVSTGGGASLEMIELDGQLPGIVALDEAK
jgi:phosphoglycerate kinase